MKKQTPECCDGCDSWGKFGKECRVYWEDKKDCTQHSEEWQAN